MILSSKIISTVNLKKVMNAMIVFENNISQRNFFTSVRHNWMEKNTWRLRIVLPWVDFVDINECYEDYDICGLDGYCVNMVGKYQCFCYPGFHLQGRTCVGEW